MNLTNLEHRAEFSRLIESEMGRFGLLDLGWNYSYDNAKKRLGCCYSGKKLITFSLPYVDINEVGAMHNTVLHEIAHAIVGARFKHSFIWQNMARRIGAKPQACNSDPNIKQPTGDYVFNCKCGNFYFHKRTQLGKVLICRKCRTKTAVVLTHSL